MDCVLVAILQKCFSKAGSSSIVQGYLEPFVYHPKYLQILGTFRLPRPLGYSRRFSRLIVTCSDFSSSPADHIFRTGAFREIRFCFTFASTCCDVDSGAVTLFFVTLTATLVQGSKLSIEIGFRWYPCGWSNYHSFHHWVVKGTVILQWFSLESLCQAIFINLIHLMLYVHHQLKDQQMTHGTLFCQWIHESLRWGEWVNMPHHQQISFHPLNRMKDCFSYHMLKLGDRITSLMALYQNCNVSIILYSNGYFNTRAFL